MKKNLIALMLSIVMMVGSIGGSSVFAAESTAEAVATDSIIEETIDNDMVDEVTADEETAPLEEQKGVSDGMKPEQAEELQETVPSSENEEGNIDAEKEEAEKSVTEELSTQEEDEEFAEITEPVQVEEKLEAVSDSASDESIAQAIWTEGNSTLTFYYGPEVSAGNSFKGETVTNCWSGEDVTDTGSVTPAWKSEVCEAVTYVVIDDSFSAVKPTSMRAWFSGFKNITDLDLSGVDTSNAADMAYMCAGCRNLNSIDLSGFDTSKVTNMSHMFHACYNLTELDVSGFDTSQVTSMDFIFSCCENLTSLDVSGFDTSKVRDMTEMFCFCQNLTRLDVSGFDTSNVTDMACMFAYCDNLTYLDMNGLDLSKVTNMRAMFKDSPSLICVDLSGVDTNTLSTYFSMFDGCKKLETIYCKDSTTCWNPKGGMCLQVDMTVFQDCKALVGVDGDARVSYRSYSTYASMAKSASLGGYFTPKPVTVEFYIEFTNLNNVIHLGETAVGAIMTASVSSADVNTEMKNTVWSIEDPEFATIEKMGSVVGNAVQFSINAKRPGKTNLIATLSDGTVISKEITIEPKMTVSVGAKLNNGKIDEINRIISYSNVWCSVSLEGYEADKEYLDYFIQNVTYNKEEIEAAAEIIEDIEETTFVSEDGLTAWKKLRIGHKENKESNSVHVVFTSPEKVRAEKYFYAQKDWVAELTYRASGTKWAGDGHHSFLFSDSYFYHDSNVYSNDLAVMSLGLELSAWTSHDYDDYNADIIPTGREQNLRDAFLKLGFKNPVFFKYDIPLSDFTNYAAFGIAKKTISNEDQDDTLIAVVIRGGGYGAEWASNFDVGNSGDHVGFNNSAGWVLAELRQYINDLKESGEITGNIKTWVVGYSRGAAVANILGHKINRGELEVSIDPKNNYVYTFATPSGQRGSDHTDINIFNIVSRSDIVPKVALSEGWHFSKYGTTYGIYGCFTNNIVNDSFRNFTGQKLMVGNAESALEDSMHWMLGLAPDTDVYTSKLQDLIMSIMKLTNMEGSDFETMAANWLGLLQALTNPQLMEEFLTLSTGYNELWGQGEYNASIDELGKSLITRWINGINIVKMLRTSIENATLISLFHAHNSEHYLAWLESGGIRTMDGDTYANLNEDERKNIESAILQEFEKRVAKRLDFCCPVDITIYSSSGRVVGRIEDNTVISNEIPCFVNGDTKVIYIPVGDDYHLELTGTDYGKMDYCVREYSDDFSLLRTVEYFGVDLSPGIEYETAVSDSVLDLNETYALTSGDITTVPAIDTERGIEAPYYTLSVVGGEAEYYNIMCGEEVTVNADKPEDDTFAKWISDDEDVYFDDPRSENTTVRIAARDTTITAHFASEHQWNEEYTVDVEPGENEPGAESIHCTICDEIQEGSQIEIPSIEDSVVIASGTCGDGLTWTLIKNGTLTISGSGAMEDYDSHSPVAPWNDYKQDIKKVVIKKGVTTIGYNAFCGCIDLRDVKLPEGLESIGQHAFDYCSSLPEITFPSSLKSIDFGAFTNCTSLTSVTLPIYMENIVRPFINCSGLTRIYVEEGNTHFASIDGVLYNKDCTKIICYPAGREGTYSILDSVTEIERYAFAYCGKLTGVTIPDSVSSIGSQAFRNCTELSRVIIPKNTTQLPGTFLNCSNLSVVVIPSSLTSIGYLAFSGCNNLSTIYYIGTEEEWESVEIGSGNNALDNATIVFIDNPNDLKYAEVTGLSTQKYTGKPITSAPTVTQLGRELEMGKDYTVSYSNNTVAGTATVTITGIGKYMGNATGTFTILPGKTTRGDMFNLANNVKVTWKEVPGAKYYKVYRYGVTDTKESRRIPVIVTTGLVGWDKEPGLTNGHAYRYTIVASLTGKGDSSGDSKLFYTKFMYRLKTVVIRSVKNTVPGGVLVTYDKTTSGDSYVLQYSENQDMSNAKTRVIKGAGTTSYTIGGLKKGKTYYISIRVRKKVDGIDYYTTFGVPKKITITK